MMSTSKRVKITSEDVTDLFLDNVHVWQVIFDMLEVKDQIRLEMTNKRVRMLMLAFWKRVTWFETEGVAEMSFYFTRNESRKKRAVLVAICVDRIAEGLRSLTIREMSPAFWIDNLRSIGEGCPNVETINCIFEDGTLDIRFDSFSRLKTLTVSTPGGHFMPASASVFLSIPTSIEVIRGLTGTEEEPFENAAQMEGFFADRPSLGEICLGNLFTRDKSKPDLFRVIAQRCPHLKSIKLALECRSAKCIDFSGVVALESMKELRMPNIPSVDFDEMQIVTICERSPLVEALELTLRFSSNPDLQSAALNALGALTKLAELRVCSVHLVAPSLMTEFVRELARNSGASLRRLYLGYLPLPTAAIEALANGCGKLRNVLFYVRVGGATPASIRFLIDSIVAHPSWIPQTGEAALLIEIGVMPHSGYEFIAGMAAFEALAAPAANLPPGVELIVCYAD